MYILVPWKPVVIVWGLAERDDIFLVSLHLPWFKERTPLRQVQTMMQPAKVEADAAQGGPTAKALPQNVPDSESVRPQKISFC